mmetsp:Transcript_56396/g.125878  ORF Transcript_56396/g.125878 Transcript_56396/m.125878 type:complete len:171 (-) Transcript_56396:323-835(-)
MSAVPRRHLVENRICEAKRLSRAAQLHKQRLESIAAGRQHRPLYDGPPQPPLPARRRNPRLEAERALGDKLHAANLRRIGSRPGGIAELQHRTTPREEVGRFNLPTAVERQRRQAILTRERENATLGQRVRTVGPRFASDSTIRALQNKPLRHHTFASPAVDASDVDGAA